VRNSINQPICIAELQLVWHDASTDSQLASARLYFRPEDTPAGRLGNHGQVSYLYNYFQGFLFHFSRLDLPFWGL